MPDEQQRSVLLPEAWRELLGEEFEQPYMKELAAFLRERRAAGATLYPPPRDIFRAFWETAPDDVRIVILGQDPYHNPGQAHGLCFSVNPGVPTPPSLVNIYKELATDLHCSDPGHGCLLSWARQGVLLLNSVLTVEKNSPACHQGKGWERFTDRVVAALSAHPSPKVFLLWGAYAQKKGRAIDAGKHRVLTAPHPSPLSAHRGFFGCRHFSKANTILQEHGLAEVDWQLPPVEEVGTPTESPG